MNKFKILTILFISLFAFNVSALVDEYGNQTNGSTINIYCDENGMKVYDGDTLLSDASQYAEFTPYPNHNTNTIWLKEDINRIEVTNINFVVTTHKKTISINDFYAHKITNVDNKFTIYKGSFDAAFIVFERAYTETPMESHEALRFYDYETSILNSRIETKEDDLHLSAESIYIEHSGVSLHSLEPKNYKITMKDAAVDLDYVYGKVYLDNTSLSVYETYSSSFYVTNMSNLSTTIGGHIDHLFLDNSEFEYIYDGGNLNYKSIEIEGRLSIHNSLFTIDFKNFEGSKVPTLIFDNDNYEFDDHMSFVDSEGRALYKYTWPDSMECLFISPSIMDEDYPTHGCGDKWTNARYAYNILGDDAPKTLTVASIVEVTLKVKGTWADGTTDDIVLYKPAFSKLSYTDMPIGKMTLDDFENGDWDTKPVNAVLEENTNVVLTLTISYNNNIETPTNQEEVKGVEENPKTGLFNDVLLFIPVIISILGFKYLKRLELFKKM